MSDEDRRILEREARYNEKLASFLVCLREGHDEDPKETMVAGYGRVYFSGNGDVRACRRCHLVYIAIPLEVPEVIIDAQTGEVMPNPLAANPGALTASPEAAVFRVTARRCGSCGFFVENIVWTGHRRRMPVSDVPANESVYCCSGHAPRDGDSPHHG